MTYQTTMTRKGQITVPKVIREALHLRRAHKVMIELLAGEAAAKIMTAHDFLETAGKIRVKRRVNPVSARKYLEAAYARQ